MQLYQNYLNQGGLPTVDNQRCESYTRGRYGTSFNMSAAVL